MVLKGTGCGDVDWSNLSGGDVKGRILWAR